MTTATVALVFWVLLAWSVWDGDLTPAQAGIFGVLWVVLQTGATLAGAPAWLTIALSAALAIALVFAVFGEDPRIR